MCGEQARAQDDIIMRDVQLLYTHRRPQPPRARLPPRTNLGVQARGRTALALGKHGRGGREGVRGEEEMQCGSTEE